MSFSKLGLSAKLARTVEAMGFETPTPIQEEAIPLLLQSKRDLVGLAQTGTGKTAAFGLPLIDLIDPALNRIQGLVIAPTRELCMQITRELERFSANHPGVRIVAVYGGADIRRQIKQVRDGAQIVVATPGRLKDLINRKVIKLDKVDYVILDEADEMLNMGFKEEIDEILTYTPDEKVTWLFSATMPASVRRIANEYMADPLEVTAGAQNSSNVNISHEFVTVRPSDRYEVLRRFLDANPKLFGLVFTRTRRDAKLVADKLGHHGYRADALHGDLSQAQRDHVMGKFRSRQLRILVATDVAARGIDVADITHVFHYNLPDDPAFYTHRSGRTGRAGNEGKSIVLAHPRDVRILRRLEKKLRATFQETHIPTPEEIVETRIVAQLQKLATTEPHPAMEQYRPIAEAQLAELTKDELVGKLLTASFGRLSQSYRDARDLNNPNKSKRAKERTKADRQQRDRNVRPADRKPNGWVEKRPAKPQPAPAPVTEQRTEAARQAPPAKNMDLSGKKRRLFINIGSQDVPTKNHLINLIQTQSGIGPAAIGKIEFNPRFSVVEIDQAQAPVVTRNFRDFKLDGRDIRVNDADGTKRGKGKGKKDKKKKKKG